MSLTATFDGRPAGFGASADTAPSSNTLGEVATRWAVALAVFLGAFVLREPAPYELFIVVLIPMALILGLRLGTHALVLAGLFSVFFVGGLLSMFTTHKVDGVPIYLAVSLFLGLTAAFWCAVITHNMALLRTIFRAYVAGAILTALAGIAGYLSLVPGAEIFTRYDRAMGVFQDPNVFGPFLLLPLLYLMYGILYRSPVMSIFRVAALLIILLGLLLSFSRAAWGAFALAAPLTFIIYLACERAPRVRARLITLGILGAGVLLVTIIGALQVDAIGDMFSVRAKAVQEYDGARVGRFARHAIGFGWALENPLGIGPLVFGLRLGEDTHNVWLKALMGYGWLGFATFVTMAMVTLVGGARLLGRDRPWRPYLVCAWSAFVAHLFVGIVIDMDHWRHFYLIIGIIWGCMALEATWHRRAYPTP